VRQYVHKHAAQLNEFFLGGDWRKFVFLLIAKIKIHTKDRITKITEEEEEEGTKRRASHRGGSSTCCRVLMLESSSSGW